MKNSLSQWVEKYFLPEFGWNKANWLNNWIQKENMNKIEKPSNFERTVSIIKKYMEYIHNIHAYARLKPKLNSQYETLEFIPFEV